MTRYKNRRGVSLMEVLFSIGVIAVGLLGVVAVMPVALDQVGRGHVSDRVARLGQNAEEEFFSRDMFRVATWAQPAVRPVANVTNTHWAATVPTGGIYCIDPQFVVANVTQSVVVANPPTNTYNLNPDAFPYEHDVPAAGPPTYPVIQRISLMTPPMPSAPRPGDILRQPVAEQFFTLEDELIFNRSPEKTLPPEQEFGPGAKRQGEGNFSWIATIAPVTTMTGAVSDSYYLSIVVINRRNKKFPLNEYDEVLASIPDVNFHASGYRGGDVTIESDMAAKLDIKTGQWIMLMRYWGTAPWVRWYRVVGADASPSQPNPPSGPWLLDVTLEGPDWPVNNTPPQPMTRVGIVRGVSEVFERTIRLE